MVLEILLFISNSLSALTVGSTTRVITLYIRKRLIGSCWRAWLQTDVNKDSFESSKPGLFTSDITNKSDVCANLFVKTSKERKRRRRCLWTCRWLGRHGHWLLHFAETIGGKLATFINAHLTANMSNILTYCPSGSCHPVCHFAHSPLDKRHRTLSLFQLSESQLTKISGIHSTSEWPVVSR